MGIKIPKYRSRKHGGYLKTHEEFKLDEQVVDMIGEVITHQCISSDNTKEFVNLCLRYKRENRRRDILYGWIMAKMHTHMFGDD